MSDSTAYPTRDAVRNLMQQGADVAVTDTEFNHLALNAFRHQFENNIPYRRYCERRGRTPASVNEWTDVPAVPTAAFKEVDLVAGAAANAQLVFQTSGTTRGAEKRGRHFILDASQYEQSLLATFRAFVLPDHPQMRMMSLALTSADAPDSSLSYMITCVMRAYGAPDSATFADPIRGIDYAALTDALADAREPVALLGTSLAYLHWLDARPHMRLVLPAGSRLLDTGGFKGEARTIAPDELRARYQQQLGIAPRYCVNEYGMTELCSQYYDSALRTNDESGARIKRGPPWLRARVLDADTLQPMPRGATGILQHFDLANLDSVSAVLTEDLGYEAADGFVLLGRAPGAMPRGCSIAMDMLLTDKRAS